MCARIQKAIIIIIRRREIYGPRSFDAAATIKVLGCGFIFENELRAARDAVAAQMQPKPF